MTHLRRMVADRLVEDGFRRARHGYHLRRMSDDFTIVVDVGPMNPLANDITPWIGIRSEAVERLRSDLMGLKNDGYHATVGAYDYVILRRSYRAWHDPAELESAIAAIRDSEQLVRRYAALDTLPDAWGDRGICQVRPYPLVTTCLLLGAQDRIEKWLAYGQEHLCARDGAVCEQWRSFAQAAREYADGPKGRA